MVPNLIWVPDFFGPEKFGPQEIRSPRNLLPKKFGPLKIWSLNNLLPRMKMPYVDFRVGTKFLGDQKGQGPNEIGDHVSCSHLFPFTTILSTNSTDFLFICAGL